MTRGIEIKRPLASERQIIIYEKNTPLGFLHFRYAPGRTCEIVNFQVETTHRRQGIGTELIKTLEEDIRGKAQKIYLFCAEENQIGKLFYKSLGFREVKLGSFYINQGASIFIKELK